MVRVVKLGLDPVGTVQNMDGAFFHSHPEHYSYQLLIEAGIDVKPLRSGDLIDGTLLVPERTGHFYDLVYIVDRLLGPGGCPWDIEQTHESLKKYLIEEAYEVLDAVDSGSIEKLQEELGDLLLQPLMHSQIEQRDSNWGIDEVAKSIADKLVRRHPHVFGDLSVADADEVLKNWDQIKRLEKGVEPESILAGIPKGMASLLRAYQVSKRAARSGFEWESIDGVFDKMHEEECELKEALAGGNPQEIESEVGDLLFTVVNIARWAKVEPEEALRQMLNRFCARYQLMEQNSPKPLSELSAGEWDELWNQSKMELAQTHSAE